MKNFRLIFSFLLILLILYPNVAGAMGSCNDDASCCESSLSDEKESDDDCMDLCLCSCCGSSVFFDIKKDKEFNTSKFISPYRATFIYQSQFSNNFYADIWQPPKIS